MENGHLLRLLLKKCLWIMMVMGERPRRRKQQHLSQETKSLIAERSKIKQKAPSDSNNRLQERIFSND